MRLGRRWIAALLLQARRLLVQQGGPLVTLGGPPQRRPCALCLAFGANPRLIGRLMMRLRGKLTRAFPGLGCSGMRLGCPLVGLSPALASGARAIG